MGRKRLSDKATSPTQRFLIFILVLAIIFILSQSKLRPVILSSILKKPMYISSVIKSQKGLTLKRPLGLASTEDKIYVADTTAHQVSVFDKEGEYLFSFGQKELVVPVYLTVDNEGRVYVTDRSKKAVLKFSKEGTFISNFAPDFLENPLGIAADTEDNIYVTDVSAEHRVFIFSSDGKFKRVFGRKGRAAEATEDKGYFYYPNDVTVETINNKTANIYVSDSNNHRVQVFDVEGNFKSIIDTGGLPRGLAFNNKLRNLFVVDGLGHNINVYDQKGNFKFSFGQQGTGEGALLYPNEITLLGKKQEDIYVTDRQNQRVQLFSATITPNRILQTIRELLPLLSLPLLSLLLLFVASRKKKYIVGDCFLNEVLTGKKLDEFTSAQKIYHVSPSVTEFLTKENLLENFKNLKQNVKINRKLMKKIQDVHKVSEKQAEILAMAYRKSIYHPVLLAHDPTLLKVAHDLGIEAQNPHSFFGGGHH